MPVTDPAFTGFFGSGSLFGVPSLVWWTVAVVGVGHFVYRETRFGAHVHAIGDNAPARARVRHRVARIRFAVLALCGGLAGLAGLLYAGRLQARAIRSARPT